jgi:hypothetical protein
MPPATLQQARLGTRIRELEERSVQRSYSVLDPERQRRRIDMSSIVNPHREHDGRKHDDHSGAPAAS